MFSPRSIPINALVNPGLVDVAHWVYGGPQAAPRGLVAAAGSRLMSPSHHRHCRATSYNRGGFARAAHFSLDHNHLTPPPHHGSHGPAVVQTGREAFNPTKTKLSYQLTPALWLYPDIPDHLAPATESRWRKPVYCPDRITTRPPTEHTGLYRLLKHDRSPQHVLQTHRPVETSQDRHTLRFIQAEKRTYETCMHTYTHAWRNLTSVIDKSVDNGF